MGRDTENTLGVKINSFHFIVIGNIIEGNHDFKGNMDHSNYLITNFNNTFSNINWKYATTYEINKIIKSLRTKNLYGYSEIPIKIL